jgi:hypothetical protein
MTLPGLVRANNLNDVVDRERAWDNLGNNILMPNLPDIYYNNVSLLLHGNGNNGSTTIIDSSLTPKTMTAVGDARISTTQSKFGGSSIELDGVGDRLTTPSSNDFVFGTGNFTVEAWIYELSRVVYSTVLEIGNHLAATGIVFLTNNGGNVASIYSAGFYAGAPTGSLSVWNHYAWVRSGNFITTYINGVGGATSSFTNNLTDTATITIGSVAGGSGSYDINRYIDDLRVTKGVARYTANFTPPNKAFYDLSNNSFIDLTQTITGRDILALNAVRNASTRDFIFIKGLLSAAQPRLTTAAASTSSALTLATNALPKLSPTSSGNYFFASGITLSGVTTRINGTNALSIATSPFSGSTATAPLLFRELRPQANWRFTEPMPSGTIASPEFAIPFETNDFVLFMKAGPN